MSELVDFFVRSRNFILFVLLEVLCFYFIVSSSNYWGVTYFNTSNYYAAKVLAWSNTANEYANLRQVNADLAQENQRLNNQVTQLLQSRPPRPRRIRCRLRLCQPLQVYCRQSGEQHNTVCQ